VPLTLHVLVWCGCACAPAGLKVIGKGTEFTKEFSLASAVYFTLAKDAFDIASVDSDTRTCVAVQLSVVL